MRLQDLDEVIRADFDRLLLLRRGHLTTVGDKIVPRKEEQDAVRLALIPIDSYHDCFMCNVCK